MNDNELYARIWKYVITGVVVLVLAGLGSCQGTRYQKRLAIEAGASPMAASCAIEGSTGTASGCSILAAAEAEAIRK